VKSKYKIDTIKENSPNKKVGRINDPNNLSNLSDKKKTGMSLMNTNDNEVLIHLIGF